MFTLRVEDPDAQDAEPQQFHTLVPTLCKGGPMHPSMHTNSWAKRLGLTKAPKVFDPLKEL